MENWTRFNLNEYVRFKVGERAKEAYINHFAGLPSFSPESVAFRFDSILDSEGFLKMQLWQAMSIFGRYMFAGSDIIDCGEFYLSSKHLTPPLPNQNP